MPLPTSAEDYPVRLPTPGGEVILPTLRDGRAYDQMHFAAARRAGDMLYVSGVIIGPRSTDARDGEAFRAQVRVGLERLKGTLEASGVDFSHVAMINSFHVWDGPGFQGSQGEQIAAFAEVLADYLQPPYPAWTAVGTSGLLANDGVVEVQLIAYAPASTVD